LKDKIEDSVVNYAGHLTNHSTH